MFLFKKNIKYNYKKDYLNRFLDVPKREFYYAKMISGVYNKLTFDDLDKETKKRLILENEKLKIDDNLYQNEIEKIKEIERRKYLKSIGYTCDSFEYLGEADGTLSDKMQELLSNLLSNEHSLLGIHRVGAYINNDILNDIFDKGLQMTGHFAIQSKIELKNNIGYYPNNKTIIKELMHADFYKNSVGSILVCIPDEALEASDDIIIENDGMRLNPKYIMGYVPLYENHHLEDIVPNPNYNVNLKRD